MLNDVVVISASYSIFNYIKFRQFLMNFLKSFYLIFLIFGFVIFSHLYISAHLPAQTDPSLNYKWHTFKNKHKVSEFGKDGYFVRAIQNGHALFYKTWDYAWRFTRRSGGSSINSCADCHKPIDMAFAFVNSDRYKPSIGKRVSFEEQITRCYIKNLDGFAPTIYDPAIRDIRIMARMVAHYYKMSEGATPSSIGIFKNRKRKRTRRKRRRRQ